MDTHRIVVLYAVGLVGDRRTGQVVAGRFFNEWAAVVSMPTDNAPPFTSTVVFSAPKDDSPLLRPSRILV